MVTADFRLNKYVKVKQETLDDQAQVNKIWDIVKKLLAACPAALVELVDDIRLLGSLLADYASGSYRDVSPAKMLIVLFALTYLVSPVDLTPDFIPFIGFTDDATVLALAVEQVRCELDKYRNWISA